MSRLARVFALFALSVPLSHAFAEAFDLAHPVQVVPDSATVLTVESSYEFEERELERRSSVTDEKELEHLGTELALRRGLKTDLEAGLAIKLVSFGSSRIPQSNSLYTGESPTSYRGLRSLKAHAQWRTPYPKDATTLALRADVLGDIGHATEVNAHHGGMDLGVEFLYSHRHKGWRLHGSLRSELIGEKEIVRTDGLTETQNTYNRFTSTVGLQGIGSKFWWGIHTRFGLMTDFNTHAGTSSFETDKGFRAGAELVAGYLRDSWSADVSHQRMADTFNVAKTDPNLRAEYEVESHQTVLRVSWAL